MVTIKDVAKMAGVAVSTASNALNGKTGVKHETKKRVLEVAKTLNYIPNPMAKSLVTNSTKNISVIVSGPSSFNLFTNPIFIEVIKSITARLNGKGYHTLLNIVSMEHELEEIPRIANSRTVEAMILIGTRQPDDVLAELLKQIPIPAVVVIRGAPSQEVYGVSVDNLNCGYTATKYLIDMGHRLIGFIGSLHKVSMAEERLLGYQKALHEAGIPINEDFIISGDYYQDAGMLGTRELLRRSSPRPTAIFAANDLMAFGAMEALEQEGIRIPEDISIIGCDNIPNLHLLKVPLTTISLPYNEIGKLSAEKIIGILEGRDNLQPQIVLDTELRIRNSVSKISAGFTQP